MAAAAAVTGSLLLTAITVLGSRQSRKTGGGEVTLFTVARTETRGD